VAGWVVGVGDGADGLGDRVAGAAVGLATADGEVWGAANVMLGLAGPAGMAQPATSETISAMGKLRTSNRCRGRAGSQRRVR
jgi:hypothetical protein